MKVNQTFIFSFMNFVLLCYDHTGIKYQVTNCNLLLFLVFFHFMCDTIATRYSTELNEHC